MADSPILPGDRAWRDGSGKPMPVEFYRFFRDLLRFVSQSDSNASLIAAIIARIEALESELGGDIDGQMSVDATQQGADTILRLVGDVLYPDAASYYGTDAAGARGWYRRLLSTLYDVDLTGLADGDTLVWDAVAEKWEAGQAASAQIFNYITSDGDPYATEDYADLYVGEL